MIYLPDSFFLRFLSSKYSSLTSLQGMNLPRYITPKPPNASEEEEQEEYERNSDFFVTTQTLCPPYDFEPGTLARARFGVTGFFPENSDITCNADGTGYGIP